MLDQKLEAIRQDVLSTVDAAQDPEAKVDELLKAAGVDTDGISSLDFQSWPTSLSFYLGTQHAKRPGSSLNDLYQEVQDQLDAGKDPEGIMADAGIDPADRQEIDDEIEADQVAFLVGSRFVKEGVAA